MSLSRLALRLATMEALRPSGLLAADGPWPTLAGHNVFDTRIDPIDDMDPVERRPIACVYTEDDNGKPIAQNGPAYYDRIEDLIIEMSVIGRDESTIGVLYTDAELEARLDGFGAQVRFALHLGPTGMLWRKVVKLPAVSLHELPHRTSEEGFRLAIRTMRLRVRIMDDACYDPSPVVTPAGLAALPGPLGAVLGALAGTAYGDGLISFISPLAPFAPLAVPLKRVGLDIAAVMPQTPNAPDNIEGLIDSLDNPPTLPPER